MTQSFPLPMIAGALTLGLALAAPSEALAFTICIGDADGDGYYAASDTAYDSATTSPATCVALGALTPSAKNAGDCDGADGAVYPRAPELGDGKDNDCDGVIDEPVLAYYVGAPEECYFPITKALKLTVNDASALAYLNDPATTIAYYRLRIAPLDNSAAEWTFDGQIGIPFGWYSPDLHISQWHDIGLEYNTIYRIHMSVLDDNGLVLGPESDIHYSASGGDSWAPNDELTQHRLDAVIQGLHELGDYRLGLVGSHGVEVGGTRYGAPAGQPWCDQFYSWVVTEASDGLGFVGLDSNQVRGYFRDPLLDGYRDPYTLAIQPDSSYYDDGRGQFGTDYYHATESDLREAKMGDFLLGTADGASHVAMFLGYDVATSEVISLEGNVGDAIAIMRRVWSPAKFVDPTTCTSPGICPSRNYWVGVGHLQDLMFHP